MHKVTPLMQSYKEILSRRDLHVETAHILEVADPMQTV